jgi:adenosine deaminase
MQDFIGGLPKCELHLHIEGTLEPELRFELARRNGMELPYATPEELRAAYDFDSLTSFLVVYYDAMSVLRTVADFHDLAMAYLRRAAAQNVRHVEIFFDPQAHTSRGVPIEVVIDGLHGALGEARAELGIDAQLILCFLRDLPADSAMETLLASLPHKDRILGVGLDSDERGNPPEKFAAVFARAREEGYRLTMHCDVDQENSTTHIRQALDLIGVERIDHGVNCLEDPELVATIRERGLGLTVCPVSNRWVTGTMKTEAIRTMLDEGLRVTLNSDDPGYFGAYVEENIAAVAEALDLGRQELVQLSRNAFEAAWLSPEQRAGYLAELEAYARSA